MSTKTTAREPIGRLGQRRQVVIPKEICDALKLAEGDFVAFTPRAGGVFIRPKRVLDPDDILSPAESARVAKARREMREGKYITLTQLEHELDRTPSRRRRKTA